METSLVMQRWLAGQGIARDLLIGVSAPGAGFRAHAWLDAPDGSTGHSDLAEIHRHRTPTQWLAPRPT